jgi:hypothetical protein
MGNAPSTEEAATGTTDSTAPLRNVYWLDIEGGQCKRKGEPRTPVWDIAFVASDSAIRFCRWDNDAHRSRLENGMCGDGHTIDCLNSMLEDEVLQVRYTEAPAETSDPAQWSVSGSVIHCSGEGGINGVVDTWMLESWLRCNTTKWIAWNMAGYDRHALRSMLQPSTYEKVAPFFHDSMRDFKRHMVIPKYSLASNAKGAPRNVLSIKSYAPALGQVHSAMVDSVHQREVMKECLRQANVTMEQFCRPLTERNSVLRTIMPVHPITPDQAWVHVAKEAAPTPEVVPVQVPAQVPPVAPAPAASVTSPRASYVRAVTKPYRPSRAVAAMNALVKATAAATEMAMAKAAAKSAQRMAIKSVASKELTCADPMAWAWKQEWWTALINSEPTILPVRHEVFKQKLADCIIKQYGAGTMIPARARRLAMMRRLGTIQLFVSECELDSKKKS